MQIVVMRHGKPEIDLEQLKKKRVSAAQTGTIINSYENAGLSSEEVPTEAASAIAQMCNVAFSSHLPRAFDSIHRLGIQSKTTFDHAFAESALPYLEWHWPRLSFFTYCILFRLLWLLGFSKNGESIRSAKERAKACATKLEEQAEAADNVLLLGHGIMNRLITHELKRKGWNCDQPGNESYWSYLVFRK